MTGSDGSLRRGVQWAGLAGGPLLALAAFLTLPDRFLDESGLLVEFTGAGRATLAAMVWMAVWWLTEAIDISATALLPLALFPALGLASMKAAAAPYAHELIFLFMGGFLLALSMQRWGLDRRIALLTLRVVGTKPANMVAGFMIATAVLSAFVSNTATTAMMLPIGLSVIDQVLKSGMDPALRESGGRREGPGRNFALCLMLGIAYAASIGGVATIIGTPPNVFLVSFVKDTIDETYRMDISFLRWMSIGVPLAAVFLPLTWLLLTRVLYPIRIGRIEGGRELIEQAYRRLGPVKRGEWCTFIVFCLTATAWILRSLLPNLPWRPPWLAVQPFGDVTDATIVMIAALVLFVLPVDFKARQFVMNWDTAKRLPFGILILFGGGLSLAAAVEANGVTEFFGSLSSRFQGAPALALVLVVTAAVIFLTELTSNTATTAAMVPILAAVAPGLGVHPFLLIVPAAIAASCAFMMPVATPPNAIVFGSGYLTIPQMCKAGLWLNLAGILLITTLTYAVVIPVLGIP